MGTAAWQQISGVLGLNCGRCPVHTVHPTLDRDSAFGKETLMMSHENKPTTQPNRRTESVSESVDVDCDYERYPHDSTTHESEEAPVVCHCPGQCAALLVIL